jgi:hypothetical protein
LLGHLIHGPLHRHLLVASRLPLGRTSGAQPAIDLLLPSRQVHRLRLRAFESLGHLTPPVLLHPLTALAESRRCPLGL